MTRPGVAGAFRRRRFWGSGRFRSRGCAGRGRRPGKSRRRSPPPCSLRSGGRGREAAIELPNHAAEIVRLHLAADLARAEALVAQALAASPRSAYAHFVKGHVLRAQKRWEEAVLEFETALALNPNPAEPEPNRQIWTPDAPSAAPTHQRWVHEVRSRPMRDRRSRGQEWREPTGFVWFAPAGSGNVWVDVYRRIIQNYPHGRLW
jgi:tetratricopeptide (TPR) repeat protein